MPVLPSVTGPWWLVIALSLAGAGVGLILMPRLTSAGYRLDHESGPLPFPAWTVPVTVAAAWGGVAWQLGPRAEFTLTPALLTFTTAAVALTWIDADVHRLPTGLIWPTFWLVTAQLVLTSAVTGAWVPLIRALILAALFRVVFSFAANRSRGGFGRGDPKMLTLVALVTGYLSLFGPFTATVLALVLNAVWLVIKLARGASRRDEFALGPWLALGGYATLLLS
ncbi:MAG: A24 family peptidase [Humibacillus sp.]|nr:A24 family peptidase [Humibacillus sp.]